MHEDRHIIHTSLIFHICHLLSAQLSWLSLLRIIHLPHVSTLPHDMHDQVKKYQELAAENIRFDAPLADACFEDRQRFCGSVPPVRSVP